MSSHFTVLTEAPEGRARVGILDTAHGLVETPVFMPVASQASVKAVSPRDLKEVGATMVLANAYHLYLRPGVDVIEKLGGLHRFMSWDRPILTDSGGYQVFSLATLRQVSDEGVLFRSHIDGSEHFITPELAVGYQERIGADVIMAFDECPPSTASPEQVEAAMRRTHLWAVRCVRARKSLTQSLYGIVQGGVLPALRRQSTAFISGLGFDGYGLGGLSLGERKENMLESVAEATGLLPGRQPRYLMGVGSPEDLLECVDRGVDLFDCALPTRTARNGALFTPTGRVNVRNAGYALKDGPLDPSCDCYMCRSFSAAYVHHLFRSQELLAYSLATIHNLRFTLRLMENIRRSIVRGGFASFKNGFLSAYRTTDEDVRLSQKQKWISGRHRARTEED